MKLVSCFQVRDCVDNFFGQCVRPMVLLMQTFGHNRARQRDKIPALLEELALVQEEVKAYLLI
jgi:N-alpha-acetyltransferase 35, NatC auxiliary subunit